MDLRTIFALITLSVSVVSIFVKFAYDYSRISARTAEIEKDIVSLQKQTDELYQNRLETNTAIAKLTESTNAIRERLDRLENKIDILIQR